MKKNEALRNFFPLQGFVFCAFMRKVSKTVKKSVKKRVDRYVDVLYNK